MTTPNDAEWRELIVKVIAGHPLTEEQRVFIFTVLDHVCSGIDPREFAGTLPAPGRKALADKAHSIVGYHYNLLCLAGDKDIVALREVTFLYGVKERTARDAKKFWQGRMPRELSRGSDAVTHELNRFRLRCKKWPEFSAP